MSRDSSSSHLFAERRSAGALGLLVALGQGPVAGAQPLAGGVVNLHGDALRCPLLGVRVQVGHFAVAEEVLEPVEQLWEFSAGQKNRKFCEGSVDFNKL